LRLPIGGQSNGNSTGKINGNGKAPARQPQGNGKSNFLELLRQSIGSFRAHPAAQMAH
jgi:hypothetical protein